MHPAAPALLAMHSGHDKALSAAAPVRAPAPAVAGGTKRKHISDACTSCRRSKVKCEEAKPCTRCVNHGWRDSCVSWRQVKASQREKFGAVRADVTALNPPPPPPSKPPAGAAQSLFGLFCHGLPHGELGALFAPAEILPAHKPAALSAGVGEGRCAGVGEATIVEDQPIASLSPPPSPKSENDEEEHCDRRAMSDALLSEAGTEAAAQLSDDAEDDDFWRSVEHLMAIPIAFDKLL